MTEFLPGLTNYDVITWHFGTSTGVVLLFGVPNTSQFGTSEPLNTWPMTKTFVCTRVKTFMRINTKGALPCAIRDNGVSVLSWTVPALGTGLQFDSGPISLTIEAGHGLTLMLDFATAGAGSSSWVVFMEGTWK
jgi:hypothetical protein